MRLRTGLAIGTFLASLVVGVAASAQPTAPTTLAPEREAAISKALGTAESRISDSRKLAKDTPSPVCLDVVDVVNTAKRIVKRRASWSGSDANSSEADQVLDEIRDLVVVGELDNAKVRLRKALDARPTGRARARALLMTAFVALLEGRGVEALEALAGVPPLEEPTMVWVELMRARAHRMAGQHDEAVAAYDRVLDIDSPSRAIHYATSERADALFDGGRFEEAEKALDDVLDRYPEHPQRHRTLYRKGLSEIRNGDRRSGARTLQRVWIHYPWKEEASRARALLDSAEMKDVAPPRPPVGEQLQRAKDLRRNKHWLVTEHELNQLMARIKTERGNSLMENEVRLELALVAYEMQDYDRALPRLLDLQKRMNTPGQGAGLGKDWILTLLQRCYHRMGNSPKAEEILMKRVAGRPNAAKWRMLGDFYWDDGRYIDARKAWEKVYSKYERQGWSYAYLLYKTGDYKRAIRMLEDMSRFAKGETRARYLYWLARAHEMKGDHERAKEIFTSIAEVYELSYYGYQAENRMRDMDVRRGATLVGDKGSEATPWVLAQAPDITVDRLQQLDFTPSWGLFTPMPTQKGSVGYEQLVCREGVSLPVELTSLSLDKHKSKRAPIAGREPPKTHDKNQDIPIAQDLFDKPGRVFWHGPNSGPHPRFTGRSAPRNLAGIGHDGVAYRTERKYRGATRRVADLHRELWPSLDTVAMLYGIGWYDEAREELRHIALEFRGLNFRFDGGARALPNRPLALNYRAGWHYIDHRGSARRGFWGMGNSQLRYPIPRQWDAKKALAERHMAIYDERDDIEEDLRAVMMEVGDHHLVRLMQLKEGRWWADPPNGDNLTKWSEAYPRAYPLQVQRYAKKEGLNPYLLWALMTVESAYNPDSVSYANARGLLQVIPKTGHKVAEGIGDTDFGPYELLSPETSIRHGAWYFARLVKKFRGMEPLAIASYNGGPHNVQRWLKHKTHVPLDEFVEEIPFDQARGYTKKVLRFLALFRRIYEGQDELYVGQVLRGDILVSPRY